MTQAAASIRDRFRRKVLSLGGAAEAARALGCSRAYVDMICRGTRRPGMRVAHAIERLFGIPMQAWVPLPPGGSAPRRPLDDAGAPASPEAAAVRVSTRPPA